MVLTCLKAVRSFNYSLTCSGILSHFQRRCHYLQNLCYAFYDSLTSLKLRCIFNDSLASSTALSHFQCFSHTCIDSLTFRWLSHRGFKHSHIFRRLLHTLDNSLACFKIRYILNDSLSHIRRLPHISMPLAHSLLIF